jgi:hypothetical protein
MFFDFSKSYSQKPPLKKVSKAQQQMEKIKMFAAKANQMNHRMGLKTVKKFDMKEDNEKKVGARHSTLITPK